MFSHLSSSHLLVRLPFLSPSSFLLSSHYVMLCETCASLYHYPFRLTLWLNCESSEEEAQDESKHYLGLSFVCCVHTCCYSLSASHHLLSVSICNLTFGVF